VAALRRHGAGKVFREVASGAKTDRAQLRRLLDQLDGGEVLMVTRLDRLARSTRDLLNTLGTIADRKAGFPITRRRMGRHHYGHGRLMLTILGGLAEFERELIRIRTGEGRARQGPWRQDGPATEADAPTNRKKRSSAAIRERKRLPTSAAATMSARRRFHDSRCRKS
jgi:DNA invertase Pin-like site-specific DNA recombinase